MFTRFSHHFGFLDLHLFPIGILVTLTILLSGCLFSTNDRVAGGAEDFPNTLALGYAVSSHISDHTEWDQFSVIPTELPSIKSTDSLVQTPDTFSTVSASALPKNSATASQNINTISDTIIWNFKDTATQGKVTRIHFTDGILKSHHDTTVYRYNTPKIGMMLSQHSLDTFKVSNRLMGYQYDNLDSITGFDRAFYYDKIPANNGTFKTHIIIMLPGLDKEFSTKADNVPVYFSTFTLKPSITLGNAVDTLESFEIKDADGDGKLWGKGDSGVVEFLQRTPNPTNRPAVELVVQKMRSVIFKDETKSYPISFSETRIDKDGRKTIFSVHGTGADSSFSPGDTASVALHIYYPSDTKLLEKISRYKVLLGGQPKHFGDNKLLDYELEARWRKDSLVVTHFSMKPDKPVLAGDLSINGNLSVTVNYEDSSNGDVTGRFENKIIEADLEKISKAGKSRRFHIRWDDRGNVLSQIKLN